MQSLPLVDAHVHALSVALRYPWLAREPGCGPPRELDALWEELGGHFGAGASAHPARVILVEADVAPEHARAELEHLLALAREDPRVAAVVAFAPLELGADVASWLALLRRHRAVRGVRRVLQDEPDPAFCLGDGFVAGVRLAASHALLFEACVRAHQLPSVAELARRVPEATIVLDHLGKPPIARGELDPWRAHLAELAALPNVHAKLSGLLTEAGPRARDVEAFWPFVDHALQCFGPGRLVFGSDWPVSRTAGGPPMWLEVVDALLERAALPSDGRARILAGNALALYLGVRAESRCEV